MADKRIVEIGSLKKGSYVIIDGAACVVTDVKISAPGKHGSSKVNLTAVGIIDGKKRNIVKPSGDSIEVPIIEKKNAQVLSIQGDTATVMDLETYETFELQIPDELKDKVAEGVTVQYWEILNDRVMKQVRS